jgi:hypothetical protein
METRSKKRKTTEQKNIHSIPKNDPNKEYILEENNDDCEDDCEDDCDSSYRESEESDYTEDFESDESVESDSDDNTSENTNESLENKEEDTGKDKEEEEEEEDEEEYDIDIAKTYGFSEDEVSLVENLDEEEIKILSEMKKTDSQIYDNFIKTKNIIKDREVSILDIIKADFPNEKRANLIEQFECLKQTFPCTEDYLLLRDKIRNMYINYLSEFSSSYNIDSSKNKYIESDVYQFKKKIKDLKCCENNRKIFEEKMEEFEEMDKGDEKSKLKRWLTTSLTLPFDTIINNNSDDNISQRIKETNEFLNKRLYGMNNVKERLLLFINKKLRESNSRGCNIALVGKPGVGKCLHPDTPVIMYNLETKLAKDVLVGDLLLGDDGTEREVLSTTNGREEMFRIYQEFGKEYVVNKSHILTLRNKENKIVDIPLTDIILDKDNYSPVSCPYNGNIFCSYARSIGRFIGCNINNQDNSNNKLLNTFSLGFTEIPASYRNWTLESKVEFFNGIIDTAEVIVNCPDRKSINIYIHKNKPIYTVMDLLRSSGIRCIYQDSFLKILGIYVPEKLDIISIGEGEYFGFTISGNERFVLGDWTVTHNTAIAKALSECLKIPFSQMSFGGVNNSEFLVGHDYTYIGSRPGEISRCLIRMGAKNGIMFLDEFDKASDKKDVMSALLHITDFSQNYEFRDNYFPELTQDLSKVWFIYSMNDLPTDPAMLDRLEVIKVDEYTIQDRIVISKNYLFPKYISELTNIKDKIILSDCGIKKIVDYSSRGQDKKGVRDLERYINLIIEKIYFYLSNLDVDLDYDWFKKMKSCYNTETEKIIVTESLVEKVLEEVRKSGDDIFLSMYM